jgi:hypothetical protein
MAVMDEKFENLFRCNTTSSFTHSILLSFNSASPAIFYSIPPSHKKLESY